MSEISNLRRAYHLLLFELGEVSYVATFTLKCPEGQAWPSRALATVLSWEYSISSSSDRLPSYVDHVLQTDDVFQRGFLANIIVLDGPSIAGEIKQNGEGLANSWASSVLSLKSQIDPMMLPVPGPHLIAEGSLWQVSRLYEDVQGAFMVAVEPPVCKKAVSMVYTPLRVSGPQYQSLGIAAPSRAANQSNGPLAGTRFAVKDMFDTNGLTTTLCNRAVYEINKPSSSTAACVQKLVDAGAHVLGTNKVSSMISREEPTEAVDYHAPFNPRADGYQSPAGSSSGSAAAVAAYEWLDFAVAEDTSGSGRRPAAANGCFQYRPTHDLVELEGMWPTFLQFDTPVILSRDLIKIALISSLWCGCPSPTLAVPTTKRVSILVPDDYLPNDNEDHMRHLESFIEDLRTATSAPVERLSIEQRWLESCPEGCEGQDLKSYLSDVVVQTFYHDFCHSQASFRKAYREKYQKEPYVNSFVKWRWNLGKNVTPEQHQEGLRRFQVYKSWFLNEVMGGPEKHSILVLPISEGVPDYRDHPPKAPVVQSGFDSLFLSPILGCPDLVIPIGQIPYESRIIGREEQLPICVNLLGMPGKDADLIDIARLVLHASGRPAEVRVGSTMF
ncbi:hypothetical protein H2200_003920 [Cladophialophora chaetospira]|uniref:Amidase domain-containing protein n=1 Tax=Cladophialophora chaetospira TaxID=386627 RepID=A0AA38XF40_9EURO|nr:hypothetical protein H2200_003920 [Cladophialophora chaetospira]